MKLKTIIQKLEKFAFKLGQEKHLLALRDGMVLSMPLILVGSLFLIIKEFPVASYTAFLKSTGIHPILGIAVDSTFGLMGLVAAFGISKRMAEIYKVDGTSSGVIGVASFILLIPRQDGFISTSFFGSKGMFVAIIIGLITGKLFAFFIKKKIVIKMPDSVPPAVLRSFTSVIPGFFIILFFLLMDNLIKFTGFNTFDIVIKIISNPLRGITDSYFGTIFVILLNGFLWMFGIHGGQLVGAIMDPVWYMNTDANRLAYEAGQALPHIVTRPFLNNFAWVGGSGACLGLAFFLFFFAKSGQLKALGKIAFVPDFFSVNEPMLFGIPIVLNPNLVIPFMLAPVVTGTIAYFATYFGLVARTVGILVPWATPPIISGYISTGGSITGPILQIVNIFAAFLVYYPFIKRLDKQIQEKEFEYEKLKLKESENKA